jgi:Asp-tRNA(Asn)/Glu-tRNA(Gln) amidotransferase A subunit family amidase
MPEGEPVFWSLDQLLGAYRRTELSPVEVTRQVLERIEAFDDELHAYITTTPELALDQARDAEARYLNGEGDLPPLLGVPVSIKDLFDVEGVPTTLGSLLYGSGPAERDSHAVGQLRAAGAVLVGKSNTSEFGQSATTENLLGPPCANPWDTSRTPGGSSGGAAASVGAGLASLALGSDGGGSIRLPAAMSGLVGLKPTYAPLSKDEKFHAMTDFVCPGPIVRRVAEARAVLSIASGRAYERRDPGLKRIGWCAAINGSPVDPGVGAAVERAVAQLGRMGHAVEAISLPVSDWLDAFGPLVLSDEWRYRRHLLAGNPSELTEYARKGIEAAAQVTDDEVEVARRRQAELRRKLAAVFEDFDFVVTPTSACIAFEIGRRPTHIDDQPVGSLWGPFPFTAAFNVTGSPAASLPCGFSDNMPVGLQIVGPHHSELDILDLCAQWEEALAFPIAELGERWSLKASPA